MNYKIIISPQAHEDILSVYNYVLKDGESIAKKQVSLIYSAIERLSVFPDIGISLNKYISVQTDYLFIVINKLYLAFYKKTKNSINVIRVFRAEQDYITQLNLTDDSQ